MEGVKLCCICHQHVGTKNYKTVAHSSAKKYNIDKHLVDICGARQDISTATQSRRYICKLCFSKIIKIDKIDEKLKDMCGQLRAGRDNLRHDLTIKHHSRVTSHVSSNSTSSAGNVATCICEGIHSHNVINLTSTEIVHDQSRPSCKVRWLCV